MVNLTYEFDVPMYNVVKVNMAWKNKRESIVMILLF
jgi:hypothetical protein